MAATYPPGGTFFDTVKKSFVDVPVDASKDSAISTNEFLQAAESLTTLFGAILVLSLSYGMLIVARQMFLVRRLSSL